jgi:protein O-mannosyl-transferase
MKTKTWWMPFLLTLWIMFVFRASLNFEFVNVDDTIHTVNHPNVNPPAWQKLPAIWQQPYRRLYIPLTYTLWEVIAFWAHAASPSDPKSLSGLSPRPFHAVNLFLHWFVVVCLVYPLLGFLQVRWGEDRWAAWWGAALFALHPVQVEPVVWISGMKDVFSGALALASLLSYVRYCEFDEKGNSRSSRVWYFLSFLSFVAALFAKPSTVMVPFLIFAMGYFFLGRRPGQLLSDLWFWFVLLCPIIVITTRVQPSEELEFPLPGLLERGAIAVDSIRFYVMKILWPVTLSLDYGETPSQILSRSAGHWVGCVGLMGAVVGALIILVRRSPWAIGSALFFLLALFPVLGFKPFVFQMVSTVADRYLYLAMLGPAICLTLCLTTARFERKKEAYVCLGLILGLLSLKSQQQVEVWRTSTDLLTHTLEKNPKSWLSHNNLGVVYESRSDWEKAAEHYGLAGELRPNATIFNNLGAVFLTQRQFYPALVAFKRALSLKQDDALLYNNLGTVWMAVGQIQKAKQSFVRALSLDPQLIQAKENLARLENLRRRG